MFNRESIMKLKLISTLSLCVWPFSVLLADGQDSDAVLVRQPPAGFRSLSVDNLDEHWYGREQMPPEAYAATTTEQREKSARQMAQHWHEQQESSNEQAEPTADSEFVIVNDGFGPFLTSKAEFHDFELLLQYKTVAKADSGIYLRGVPQVQIWDWTDERSNELGSGAGSGGLWNNAAGAKGKDPSERADRDFGQWNQFRIKLIGDRCWVWLNDKAVVQDAVMANYFDRSKPLPLSGPIQLQTHGGKIDFRNVFIRQIDAAEANATMIAADTQKADMLFGGVAQTLWRGATDNYEAVLRCKSGKGGVLFSEQDYSDFKMMVEFRLPKAGNNGLVLRYPRESDGKSDGAYMAMCELQILDDGDPAYAKLDPRQAHGSAYGMAAAVRGYLRKTGEWNYEKVTVKGSTIVVELNGSEILRTDLATIDSYMNDSEHPGKDRTSGAVGLAGHNDPVEFRLIAVEELSQ